MRVFHLTCCMSATASGPVPLPFEIKNAQLPLMALLLKASRLDEVEQGLRHRFGDTPDFFDRDALLIDLSALEDSAEIPPFAQLLPLLRRYRLTPVAVKGGNPAQHQAALDAGLAPADEARLARDSVATPAPAPAPVAAAEDTRAQPALVVDKPLRSGQQVYARGRDLIVMAMVNPGAEVIADGHIHVYAPLRGKAMAGARGYTDARIFTTSLEAELVSIAGIYRTSDTPLPPDVAGKPAHIRLSSGPDGDKLLLEPIL